MSSFSIYFKSTFWWDRGILIEMGGQAHNKSLGRFNIVLQENLMKPRNSWSNNALL
jgi:hypothetical protein